MGRNHDDAVDAEIAANAPDTTYNGWTNYETWNVKLWIDNDEGSYTYWRERAQSARDETAEGLSAYAKFTGREIFTPQERARLALADELKDHFEEQSCDMLKATGQSASMWADLLGAALSEVNWHEIAENMLDDLA